MLHDVYPPLPLRLPLLLLLHPLLLLFHLPLLLFCFFGIIYLAFPLPLFLLLCEAAPPRPPPREADHAGERDERARNEDNGAEEPDDERVRTEDHGGGRRHALGAARLVDR